jgi:hypothetical protein
VITTLDGQTSRITVSDTLEGTSTHNNETAHVAHIAALVVARADPDHWSMESAHKGTSAPPAITAKRIARATTVVREFESALMGVADMLPSVADGTNVPIIGEERNATTVRSIVAETGTPATKSAGE